jgi:hypothetical protein
MLLILLSKINVMSCDFPKAIHNVFLQDDPVEER